MGYFPVRYDSRVVIYERKMFIRLATEVNLIHTMPFSSQWAFIYERAFVYKRQEATF